MQKPTIFCDSAENTVRSTVNRFGKIMKFDNGGYRVGLVVQREGTEDVEAVFYNTQCPDQFAGECYAVLKSVELAKELGLAEVVIRNDRISSFLATTKRGYKGTTYLWLASKMAKEAGIEIEFEKCSSAENLADGIARRQGSEQGIQKPRSQAEAEAKIAKNFESIEKAGPTAVETKVESRTTRGPEYEAWFAAHKEEWPKMKEAWKAEGLSSKSRDLRLQQIVADWAKAQPAEIK